MGVGQGVSTGLGHGASPASYRHIFLFILFFCGGGGGGAAGEHGHLL